MHMTTKRLRRSKTDAVIGGVAGGLGAYFGIASVVIRLGWLVLTLLGGAGVLAYLLDWMIIPDEEGRHTTIVPLLLLALILLPVVLVPISLFQWLLAERLLKGRGREAVFWTLAVLTSVLEPLGLLDVCCLCRGWLPWRTFCTCSGGNLFQTTLFRRYGFLAAIATRVAFYVIWHVLYIH